MEFFFPDSQDQVSPFFDFESEEHPPHRVRQRDDRYAHETLRELPYDGILISKAIVDGSARGAGKYTMAQQQRVYRLGAHRFFRAEKGGVRLPIMGDCGAFNYAEEFEPPYTVAEVADFYQGIGLDRGVAVDHIVFGYLSSAKRDKGIGPEPDWIRRRDLTIQLASEFLATVRARGNPFEPVGVAHGWDPASFQLSVKELQDIGYRRIALGGMVPLKTPEILEVVAAASDVRNRDTGFHLLGVTRTEHMSTFKAQGVTSFDSTSAFRQAFMDDRDNYYTLDRNFIAIRVPQVDGNLTLKKRIRAGQVDQRVALKAERACLESLRGFDQGVVPIDDVLGALRTYEQLHDTKGGDRTVQYRETLEAAPWKNCRCGICDQVGVEVILFRGSERNKRRGFHNLTTFRHRIEAMTHSSNQIVSAT
jgi:hypothetical protein